MKRLILFMQKEMVLVISFLAALISMIFIPPDKAYQNYINYSVLVLLFCLMIVVAGLKQIGVFDIISQKLLSTTKNLRLIAFIFINLCFFTAMLITNDVALITFVPLTISLLYSIKETKLIIIIVLETIAANLGSMLTPIGNPQNLYLYSAYEMTLTNFIVTMLPIALLSLLLVNLSVLFIKPDSINTIIDKQPNKINKKSLLLYTFLFLISLLTVIKVLDFKITFIITVLTLFFYNRQLFKKVDYFLLLTFLCFFIFVGNLGRIEVISSFLSTIISGREIMVATMISQVTSNVPAGIMLKPFTENAHALIMGLNLGGLGTLIASLASLISFQFYSKRKDARKLKYICIFSLISVVYLIILIPIAHLLNY